MERGGADSHTRAAEADTVSDTTLPGGTSPRHVQLSEFEEIQQSLHPFAMGHSTLEHSDSLTKDAEVERKSNCSHSADPKEEVCKVLREPSHHKVKRRDRETVKTAVPITMDQEATARTKPTLKRSKQRPKWQ